jgi:hypothetical protein
MSCQFVHWKRLTILVAPLQNRKPGARIRPTATKPLALRFFFNEAFRFDAQTYADWKHQSAPRISIEVSREPARHSGVSAARLPAILMAAAFGALFARRTKCL